MPHNQIVLLDHDPALEHVLRALFHDQGVDVSHADAVEELRAAVAGQPVTAVISTAWVRPTTRPRSAARCADALAHGRTAAVIMTNAATNQAPTAPDPGGSAMIVNRPYQLDRLPTLVWAALGHEPNADSAPAS